MLYATRVYVKCAVGGRGQGYAANHAILTRLSVRIETCSYDTCWKFELSLFHFLKHCRYEYQLKLQQLAYNTAQKTP